MRSELAARALSYAPAGSTSPGAQRWTTQPAGLRAYERTVRIGHGSGAWETARDAVLTWGVKTRSGFTVEPGPSAGPRVERGADYWLVAAVGPFAVREPVRVVAVVEEPNRCGFAYGTLEGHPVSGEEAFIVHRSADDQVWLTLRSLTRAASGPWRSGFPAILVAQRWYRARYLRALLP